MAASQDGASDEEGRRRMYRSSLLVVAAVFFSASIFWALTGAVLPFLQQLVFALGGGSFIELVRKINFAAQSVSYAGLFTLGGAAIVAHLVGRLTASRSSAL